MGRHLTGYVMQFSHLLNYFSFTIFTARCTIVHSALLRLHDVRPSVRPSVCLSVTLVDKDHIGLKSWELTARTISQIPSLFVAQRPSTYCQGKLGTWGNLGETRGGCGMK